MNRFYYSLLFLLSISAIGASQIVIDNSTFPVAGDTLFTTFAVNPEVAVVGESGGDKFWNFEALTGNVGNAAVYLDAEEGMHFGLFPEADLVVRTENVQDIYLKVEENKITEIGRAGDDPLGFGLDANLRYTEMPVIRRAPIVYGSSFATDLEINFTVPVSELPDSLVIPFVDSLRLTIISDIEGEVDAWGTMVIPEGEFDVLRLHNVTETTTALSAYSQLLGWVELDPSTLPLGELGELLEPRETDSYVFYSNQSKEPIAIVTMDENGEPAIVEYKGRTEVLSDDNIAIERLRTYPNPSQGLYHMDMRDLPKGVYRINLYSMEGRIIKSELINTNVVSSVTYDLSPIQEDVLIAVLRSEASEIVFSEKIILIH